MKLTKAAVLAANDDIQGKIGFNPPLDTKLKADALYFQLHQKVLEVGIDDDDREDLLKDSTCDVIDALAAKFPNVHLNERGEAVEMEAEAVEEAPVEEVKEEKPKKKAKAKKAKKEEVSEPEPEVAEKPAPKKKAKSKKGKVDPLALAEEIKTDRKIKRDGLYAIVNDNAALFGDAVDTLLSITNPMVLKKQMRNVLEGGKVEMTKTKKPTRKPKEEAVKEEPKAKVKKEKKVKKVKATLRETVDAAEDLDALQAIAKANKDSFPGVKAKKFDKLKKLRKAMLKVIVEKKKRGKTAGADLKTIRAERQKRIDFMTKMINDNGGSIGRKKLTAKALEAFPNPAKSIRDIISYGKNPKYNKFAKLLVEVDGVIGWEGKVKPAKKSKAKKEAPVKEKKNKKGKKSKK